MQNTRWYIYLWWEILNLFCAASRSRPLTLNDLQRALQGGTSLDGHLFAGGGAKEGASDALRLLPTAVRLLTERASYSDWALRTSWLSHLTKSYKHAPGRLPFPLLLF